MQGIRIEVEEIGGWALATAWDDEAGVDVGWLETSDGVIDTVEVIEGYRRRGIATALRQKLVDHGIDVQHNWAILTEDGFGWAGSLEPEKTRLCRQWDAERAQAVSRGDLDFVPFDEWLARRPQLEPVETGVPAAHERAASVSGYGREL